MDATKSFLHKDYELLCGARSLDRGRFAPTLCVSKQIWPTRPRQIALLRGDFPSADSAIHAAYSQGLDWISNFG